MPGWTSLSGMGQWPLTCGHPLLCQHTTRPAGPLPWGLPLRTLYLELLTPKQVYKPNALVLLCL